MDNMIFHKQSRASFITRLYFWFLWLGMILTISLLCLISLLTSSWLLILTICGIRIPYFWLSIFAWKNKFVNEIIRLRGGTKHKIINIYFCPWWFDQGILGGYGWRRVVRLKLYENDNGLEIHHKPLKFYYFSQLHYKPIFELTLDDKA